MFVVDTNVLLYAVDRDAPEYERCRDRLALWRKDAAAWYLTWGIVYEFLRVSTHPRIFRKPWGLRDAWRFMEALFVSPGLSLLTETERHAQVAQQIFHETSALAGNRLFDAHTAVLMREHGIRRIYTRDMDFHQFAGIDVIDPLRREA